MRHRLARYIPIFGIAFVAFAVVAAIVGGNTPNDDASTAKIVSFYSAHHARTFASGILIAYAGVFFAFFGASLWSRVRAAATPAVVPAATLVGTTVTTVALLLWGLFRVALGSVAHKPTITPPALQALHVVSQNAWLPMLAGVEILLLAVAVAAIAGRALPSWLGWVALLLGIVELTPIGFFAVLAFLIWTLVGSAWMMMRPVVDPPPARVASE